MKVKLFDLKSAPMFQGEIVKEIHSRIHGKILAAGDVEPTGENWRREDVGDADGQFFVYVKTKYVNGEVESVWRCDGVETGCVAAKYPGKD